MDLILLVNISRILVCQNLRFFIDDYMYFNNQVFFEKRPRSYAKNVPNGKVKQLSVRQRPDILDLLDVRALYIK